MTEPFAVAIAIAVAQPYAGRRDAAADADADPFAGALSVRGAFR